MCGKTWNLLVDPLLGHVAPVDHPGAEHKVQRRRRLGVVHDRRHLAVVQRNLADVVAPRKQQRRVPLGGLALGVVARVPQVSGHAFALERADLVGAPLRAGTGLLALVDVLAGAVVDQFVAVWELFIDITSTFTKEL